MDINFATDIIGATVLGAFDVGATRRDLDRIKPMSVSQAKVLLKYGQQVIDSAIKAAAKMRAPSPWGTIVPIAMLKNSAVPQQDSKRSEVYWKLKWHEDALSKLFAPGAVYGAADDLKKWVQQAFIEFNAVQEGTAYAEENWNAMLNEIKTNAIAVIEKAGEKLKEDRKSTRLNSSHIQKSRMPSSA